MNTIYRYTVETADEIESQPYDTFAAADEVAQRLSGKVIEYTFEFADSALVADYSPSSDEEDQT